MDRCRTAGNRNARCINYDSINFSEPEYDVVDDQEEVLNVRILPARPINEDREYADRDLPRSLSGHSLSSLVTGNSSPLARCPSRDIPHIPGPAVNRDLKPGRRKFKLDRKLPPVPIGDQHSNRQSPSPPPTAIELGNPRPTLQKPKRQDFSGQQRTTKKTEFNSHAKSSQGADRALVHQTTHRRSLDLESHNIDIWSQKNLERVPSKRQHHEWPQTKEDIDQNDFVPKEKPKQIYCEEDWYVGACSRADAEHALHLVNRDGAFLVRDCSGNTNSEPLVLAVYHEKKVYNVKIRFIDNINKYALGTGQRSKDMFDSVADIIKFHTIFPIILISGRNIPGSRYPENCVLTCPVTRRDVDQLLQ